MEKQGKEFTQALSDQGKEHTAGLAKLNTTLAVSIANNATSLADIVKLKSDVSNLQRIVWALPSASVVLGLIAIAVAYFKP